MSNYGTLKTEPFTQRRAPYASAGPQALGKTRAEIDVFLDVIPAEGGV